MMSKCKKCLEATKDGEPYGSPINCAFANDMTFSSNNWNCQTLSELRGWFYTYEGDKHYWRDDSRNASIGIIPIPDNNSADVQDGYIVMSWYKDRGRTGQAWVFWDDLAPKPLTLQTAQFVLNTAPPKTKEKET